MKRRAHHGYRDDLGAALARIAELEAELRAYRTASPQDATVRRLESERARVVRQRSRRRLRAFLLAGPFVGLALGLLGYLMPETVPFTPHHLVNAVSLMWTLGLVMTVVWTLTLWITHLLMRPAWRRQLAELDRQLVEARARCVHEKTGAPAIEPPSAARERRRVAPAPSPLDDEAEALEALDEREARPRRALDGGRS